MTLQAWVARLRSFGRQESGQVLPLVGVLMIGLLGMVAFGLDVGHAVYSQRELQQATDATALAAAQAMSRPGNTTSNINGGSAASPTGSGGVVASYSSATGGLNERASLPGVSVTSTMKCLQTLETQGLSCVGTIPFNAVQVTQTVSLKTLFGSMIGMKTVPLNAVATAAIRGGGPRPSNVAVIMDTTLSMNIYDSNCSNTQMQCALNGFQILLKSLNPCGLYQTDCSPVNGVATNSFDRVALFTFPNVTVGTASVDASCTRPIQGNMPSIFNVSPYGNITMMTGATNASWPGIPVAVAYSAPVAGAASYAPTGNNTATYQITGFLSDYRTSDASTTLNPGSALVKAAGASPNCGAMAPSNFDGDYGTYYAGAIYAAQASLVNTQAQNPGSENILIILGDGDSHSPQSNCYVSSSLTCLGSFNVFGSPASGNGSYPSWVSQCQQAVTAAQAASSTGTIVYTVAYGASAITGCGTDSGTYRNNPCDAMAAMASAPQDFYSDWKQTGSDGTCTSSQPVVSLNDIFTSIAQTLTTARLIPNNTT
jgi:hypothetical protein